jgi:hypothetical protein
MTTQRIESEILPGAGAAMVYTEWVIEVSPSVAEHFNHEAAVAGNRHPSEWVDFKPGPHLGLSVPLQPLPRNEGLGRYADLQVVIDGSIRLRLGDHPRWMSYRPGDWSQFRGGPTCVPVDRFPEGFFGAFHRVELYDAGERIFGPAERYFHDRSTGAVYRGLRDGPGKLVAEVDNLDHEALTGHGVNPKSLIPLLTSPNFGVPLGATMTTASGRQTRHEYQLIGEDLVGDRFLFNEGVIWDIDPEPGRTIIEIDFPQPGRGFACILWGGWSLPGAVLADATVR